jgi:serine/threonine protein kinase
LKVLHKELLADKEAVGRFYREIEAVSQISHPNIVHAYDAGPIGPRLVLAMEFVDGVDLDRLVRESGPLPPARACEYIRQAALGLQHAHERGLVHRDIKPSNLLVSIGAGTGEKSRSYEKPRSTHHSPLTTHQVKLLDLGLARLNQPVQGSRTAELTLLAGEAVTQGTPDYMAPEQALDFHTADIRADIYSLGCTFYFLLTGKPPFPAHSLTQKLMGHQQAEPFGMAELRRRLPAGIMAVLDKMLAKKPEDRFQTPGQVAQALAGLQGNLSDTQKITAAPTLFEPLPATVPMPAALQSPPRRRAARRRRIALGVGLLVLLVGVGILLYSLSGSPREPGAATPEVSAVSTRSTGPLVTIESASSKRKYDLAIARVGASFRTDRDYKITALGPSVDGATLIRTANDDKHTTDPNHLTLTLGAPVIVYVAYDKRGTKLPAWLAEGAWQPTGEVLTASGGDAQASPMKLYARRFAPGKVTLGGNKQPPAVGADSNYVVIVKPAPE